MNTQNGNFFHLNFYNLFLVLLFILIHLSDEYFYFSTQEIILFSLSFVFLSGAVYYLLLKTIKDSIKAGLIFAVLFIPFAFFAIIHDILFTNSFLSDIIFKPNLVLLITLFFLTVTLTFLIIRTGKSLKSVTKFLNIFLFAFLLMNIIKFLGSYDRFPEKSAMPVHELAADSMDLKNSNQILNGRDIFVLVFDSYTSFNSLKKYWNYDNLDLKDALKKNNFIISENGRINYNYTTLSISSMLNMEYLDSVKINSQTRKIISTSFKLIKENKVTAILKKYNYKIFNISPFDLADSPKSYNPDFFRNEPKDIFNFFMCKTAVGVLINRANLKKFDEINLSSIERTKKIIINESGPKFVFAHFMLPHDPFYFDRNGNIIPESERQGRSAKFNKHNYLEQLIFTNSKIKEIVDLILGKSRIAPIIILQGDHGYRFLRDMPDAKKESHSILFAAYFPEIELNSSIDTIIGVNLFRSIFNNYLGTDMPLLEHHEQFVPVVED